MQCNIDKRGQLVRWWMGIFCIIAGIALGLVTTIIAWPTWVYAIVAGLIAGGAFAVFEARMKWCAVRAMGFRTPV